MLTIARFVYYYIPGSDDDVIIVSAFVELLHKNYNVINVETVLFLKFIEFIFSPGNKSISAFKIKKTFLFCHFYSI